MLKGFLDRMILPGVAFDLSDPRNVRPLLGHLRSITGIVTYGRPWHQALFMGDPPRMLVMRYLWWFTGFRARRRYLALYHMNVASLATRMRYLERVRRGLASLGDGTPKGQAAAIRQPA
jgi:putative NADPH-quinone reductase